MSGDVPSRAIPSAPVADAIVRLGLPVRSAPTAIRRLVPGEPVIGRALPCRHAGSVDVFLEVLERAGNVARGAVVVIDNGGLLDEACIGDLAIGELHAAGVAGVVVDGLHRDAVELRRIGLSLWSRGSLSFGPSGARPRAADALERARIGEVTVTADDVVIADDDGVVFVAATDLDRVLATAATILETERRQAEAVEDGRSLRDQLGFADYLERHAADPDYDLRRHLRERGGAVET